MWKQTSKLEEILKGTAQENCNYEAKSNLEINNRQKMLPDKTYYIKKEESLTLEEDRFYQSEKSM
jgi:hypothetical protein